MKRTIDFSRVKALALDLDGTALRPGGVLSGDVEASLVRCRERGIRLIICTGRALDAAEKYRVPLGAEGPMVYFNGAMVTEMPARRMIGREFVGRETAAYCAALARQEGLHFQFYLPEDGGAFYCERNGPEAEFYHNHTGLTARLCDPAAVIAAPDFAGCVKCMFIAESAILDSLKTRLEKHFNGSVYIARSLNNFLEILNPAASKGKGLRLVMERLGLAKDEVIAFGDEENDLPMFTQAGFAAAPANARDAVREAADAVMPSNAEDGLAVFIREFFLQ